MNVTQPHNMYLAKVPLLLIELERIDVGQSIGLKKKKVFEKFRIAA